jgi:hypothetical protein
VEQINPAKALSIEMRAVPLKSSDEPTRSNATTAALTCLWLAATATWGHRWTSPYGDLPIDDNGHLTVAGTLWAQGLAGFTEGRLLAALEHFVRIGEAWPPNLPEMRARCYGIPSFEAVNAELLTTTTPERTPFARMVWAQITDPYNYRIAPTREQERVRRQAYDLACEAVMRGEPLPGPIAGAVEHQQPQLVPSGIPETREAREAKLASLLGEDFHPEAARRSLDELRAQESRRERMRSLAAEDPTW